MPPISDDVLMFDQGSNKSKSPESDKGYNPNMTYGKNRRQDNRNYYKDDKYYNKRESKSFQKRSPDKHSRDRFRENSHSSYESFNESKRRKMSSRHSKRSPEQPSGKQGLIEAANQKSYYSPKIKKEEE
jgi:hypothetical protein